MRVLILHASAGAGHQRAAEALEMGIAGAYPEATVSVKDILEFTPAVFRTGYAKGYLNLVRRAPELWGYVYASEDRNALLPHRRKIRAIFNKLNTHSFFKYFREFAPDAVVCTHFMPLEILSTMIAEERTHVPLHCVITDFAVHSLWLQPNVSKYYVATDEARRFLTRRGYEHVEISGIPIHGGFGVPGDRDTALTSSGLDAKMPVLLILSGGFGVGPTAELVESFANSPLQVQLIVVAGRNQKLQKKLEEVAAPLGNRCKVLGFVNNLHEIMDAADFVITKPGGLSTSETLAKKIPLILIDPIPGQEQRNSDYLLEQGAAVRLHDVQDGPRKVARILENPDRLRSLRDNAARIGIPDAAVRIARAVADSIVSA